MTEQWTATEQGDTTRDPAGTGEQEATSMGVPVPGAEPEAQDAHGGSLAGSGPGTETGA